MARRIGAIGTREAMALLVDELGRAPRSDERSSILTGIEESLRGRRQFAMPAAWPHVFRRLAADPDRQVRSRATALALTFGDPAARHALRGVLAEGGGTLVPRQEALAALLQVKDPGLPSILHRLIGDPGLGGEAVRALSAYDDPATPALLINGYASFGPTEKRDALNTLAARKGSAQALLAAVEAGKLPRADLTADLVRQLRNLKDRDLDARIGQVWGTVRETTGDRARLIARYRAMIKSTPAHQPDLSTGRAIFAKVCQQCHTLFGVGRQVGPDLTGSNRADLDYLLSNVLDPSALIGKDYVAHIIAATDGRVLTGVIRAEDKDSITVLTANETITLPKSEVAERKASEQSMMPEDLWKGLSEQEIRALVAYLASPAQVPLPASEVQRKAP